MAIKIEIEAASAAEMHEELKTLLFGATSPTLKTAGPLDLPKAEPGKVIEIGAKAESSEPVKEAPKKKRRTKAEIEAEKAEQAEATTEEAPETHEEPEEVLNVAAKDDVKAGKQYDIDDARQLIMVKGSSKKALVAGILKSYGVKVLPELSEEQLQEVYAKIEEL